MNWGDVVEGDENLLSHATKFWEYIKLLLKIF
jgi:hypothetical protein